MDNLLYFAALSGRISVFLPQSAVVNASLTYLVISFVGAIAAWFIVKPSARAHRPFSVFIFLFMFLLFLPVVGFLLVFSVVIIDRFFQTKEEENPFGTSESPIFESTANGTIKNTTIIGSVQHKITNAEVDSQSRFQALNVLRSMPLKVSVPLLRQILTDKTEDIRLFAYGMLDKQEKNINNEIHRLLEALKNEKDTEVRAFLYKQISENYWNTVYYQLAQGDLMIYALKQAAGAIENAIKIKQDDADFWTLRGKIYMKLANYEEAKASFKKLEDFGLSAIKIAPYVAEIAFMEKEYDEVRRMLENSKSFANIPSLEPLINYWAIPTAKDGK